MTSSNYRRKLIALPAAMWLASSAGIVGATVYSEDKPGVTDRCANE